MPDFGSFILLMFAAILLVSIAQRTHIPYPIALVVGGALLSFIPGLDYTYFNPNLILAVVLPPILYYSAFWSSLRDFKKYSSEICSLAFSLVIVTTLVIGVIFKWCFPEFPWALSFAFGAILSPTDAAAATSILKRFSLGQKCISILEGESLVNDASGLVLYKIAVTALLTGTFSFWHAGMDFVVMAVGGLLFGALFGFCIQTFSRRFLDPVMGAVSSFLISYATYFLALLINVSGVLAVVACGAVSLRIIARHHSSLRRMLGRVTWDMYIILLNCFIFILIGSQLNKQTSHMSWEQVGIYTGYAFLITVTLIIFRLFWVCIKGIVCQSVHLKTDVRKICSKHDAAFALKEDIIIGWSGMRGIVSLTAALALPITLDDGSPLEGRAEVIYMVFCVILFTLIIPGLTLEKLISWLNIPATPVRSAALETRRNLAAVALDEIKQLQENQHVSDEERAFLSDYFNIRFRLLELVSPENSSHEHLELARIKVVQAQRRVLLEIWEQGYIDDRVLGQLEHELDAEESHTPRAEI
jgi:Na+/H+ antiporter